MRRLLLCVVLVATASTSAMASSLTAIDPVSGQTASEARAMTLDGKYVVGISGTTGFVWDATGLTRQLDNGAGGLATEASGVGYRTVGGQQEIVAWTKSAGWPATFHSTNGTSWRRVLYQVSDPNALPAANALAGTATDVFYTAHRSGNFTLKVGKGSGDPATQQFDVKSTGSQTSALQGVSGTGRAVARRRDPSTIYQNVYYDWNGSGTPSPVYFNGLDGTLKGEAWSVNADGTRIGGMSPVLGGRSGNWPYIYDVGVPINELPTFPGTAGSTTNALPYGLSSDGRYAAGMNYRGIEKAVLWNIASSNPADWEITDLTDFFAAQGMLGGFSRLARAYSVTVDGSGDIWVGGWGVWTADSTHRAFIADMGLTPPQGTCCTQAGWGSGACTETTEEDCTGGTWLGPGSACDQCDFCPHPFADTDRDNDVDQEDFGILQTCLTGIGGGVPAGCGCFDRDNGGEGDGDIDQDDVAVFEDCASGPDVPLNPFCEGV